MTEVYRRQWEDLERFAYLAYDLPEVTDELRYWGTPREGWVAPPVYIPEPQLERPDIWRLAQKSGTFVMSSETADLLEPFLSTVGELLPLDLVPSGDRMFAFNVLRIVDCLDPAKESDDPLELYPYFLERRLPESGLFTIPGLHNVHLFCVKYAEDDDSLVDRIEMHDLKGVWFERVWSSETGPEPINLMIDTVI